MVLCGSLPDSLPAEIYGSFASYAAEVGVPVILDAGGEALAYGASRRPALVIPELATGLDPGDSADPVSAFSGLPVVLLTGPAVRVETPAGAWQVKLGAGSAGSEVPPTDAFRDALVAGFVPGIALSWSWPEMLRHAVALAAAWNPDGQLDVRAYEETLTTIDVQELLAAPEQ